MSFDLPEEQKLLRTTARDGLEDRPPSARAFGPRIAGAHERGALREEEAEMGRLGAVIPESCGGASFAFDGDPGRAGGGRRPAVRRDAREP